MLDASAAAAVLLNLGTDAPRIRARMVQAGDDLHATHLLEIEVVSVLRRYALSRLSNLSISLYPHTALLARVWDLRDNVSAHAAAYIALAETLEAPLITKDARLARAPGLRAEVEVYG